MKYLPPECNSTNPFDLEGAALHNPGKRVLALDSASVEGGILAEELTTYGEIIAIGVQIGSQLEPWDARLSDAGGSVIALDGATVIRGVYAERMTTKGLFSTGSEDRSRRQPAQCRHQQRQ